MADVTPYDIFPSKKPEKTLREIIGHLPPLQEMGQFSDTDIYHNFKKYSTNMLSWIKDLKEGQTAFENTDPNKKPHRMVNGEIKCNENKNGDKYKRCFWNKTAPCVHTRNDILSSQATIHPKDNRVFSIRELMMMMTIPNDFRWINSELEDLNKLTTAEKTKLLSREEINIRQSIGEAVPTEIFRQIAEKIKKKLSTIQLNKTRIEKIVKTNNLTDVNSLSKFIKQNKDRYTIPEILKISELSNSKRQDHAAYYTRQDICFSLIKELPEPENFKTLNILEPSVGSGNFLPLLIKKYFDVPKVNIDVIDIDNKIIKVFKSIMEIIQIPKNINIHLINDDFLLRNSKKKYDIIIGNPPFGKITKSKNLLNKYKVNRYNNKTSNIFSFFIEKAITTGKIIAFISPKSILSAPDFNKTRELLSKYNFNSIFDYGEKAFDGIKIETIGLVFNTTRNNNNDIKIESYINNKTTFLKQNYIFDKDLPNWILYRDASFDNVLRKMKRGIFNVFRDRNITKKHTSSQGQLRVLKSRNIGNNQTININNYDSYIQREDSKKFTVSKFLNQNNCILVPNLTYNPRACFLPHNCITDGSVAILVPKKNIRINKNNLAYYSTDEFRKFYMIAKNLGTRSLNIDSNSVYFFGIKK